jgi:hypothetical protein
MGANWHIVDVNLNGLVQVYNIERAENRLIFQEKIRFWLRFSMKPFHGCLYVPGVSTTLRFWGRLQNIFFFVVCSILFGVLSCKKGLLASKQLLAIYTELY